MRFFFIFLIIIIFTKVSYSQQLKKFKQKSYHALIESMYKKEVPLIFADTLLENFNDFILLDSRSLEEFEISHIENAKHVGYDDLNLTIINELNKEENIVVYCTIGYRSQEIASKLIALGFANVHNLYGGIFEWKNLNYNIVDLKNNKTDSVHTYNKMWAYWLQNGIKTH